MNRKRRIITVKIIKELEEEFIIHIFAEIPSIPPEFPSPMVVCCKIMKEKYLDLCNPIAPNFFNKMKMESAMSEDILNDLSQVLILYYKGIKATGEVYEFDF